MAESSSPSPSIHVEHIRPSLSNEHLLFVETLRDWRDPLLHGHEPLPLVLCPRCVTCKCESLKDLRSTSTHFISHHTHHHPACPIFRHSSNRTRSSYRTRTTTMKPLRRANSHDPTISLRKTSASPSKIPIRISSSYSPSRHYFSPQKTRIPRLIRTPSPSRTTTDDLYEVDR